MTDKILSRKEGDVGYLVFNNLPDLLTVAGSVIISCAGIAICWLEIKASSAKQV